MKVNNSRCIRNLSFRNLRTARRRNIIAVIAIILTTVLFTSLFTIVSAIANGYQQSNFRRIGGYNHGEFQYLTEEQFDTLKQDPAIRICGKRLIVGILNDPAAGSQQTEVSFCDEAAADMMYLSPVSGTLPKAQTNEFAADTALLSVLEIPAEIGAQADLSIMIGQETVTETFTLSGWWEHDSASPASHILLSEQYAKELLAAYGEYRADQQAGSLMMSVMLQSDSRIEQDMRSILQNNSYQPDDPAAANYIEMGVNWGYLSSRAENLFDAGTLAAIALLLLLIGATGYMIINNVFQISVAGDIQRYGLLKTIGTTNRQIRRIVLWEALILAFLSIPIGLLIGAFIGTLLVPVVAKEMNNIEAVSGNFLLISLFSILFSLFTVILSCLRPAAAAARTAPIEALRYNEYSQIPPFRTSRSQKTSLFRMAISNILRTKRRTIVTVLSMSLSLVLFDAAYTITNGFDMESYLSDLKCDYIAADPSYFGSGHFMGGESALNAEMVSAIEASADLADGGRTYGISSDVFRFVTEEEYRQKYENSYPPEMLEYAVQNAERCGDLVGDNAMLYGMEAFVLDKLRVVEGDLSLLNSSGFIAAVCSEDDYGNIVQDESTPKIGDRVTVRYIADYEYCNPDTGEVYASEEDIPPSCPIMRRAASYTDREYEVAALVTVPSTLSFRWTWGGELVLPAENLISDMGCSDIMYYAFDAKPDCTDAMEEFLSAMDSPLMRYESKQTYMESFASFRNMFLILSSSLCIIVGLVGILNFTNGILSSVLVRRREFAILRAIGMTSSQLRNMLIYEGILISAASLLTAAILCFTVVPLLLTAVSTALHFFTFRLSAVPILISAVLYPVIGMIIPLIAFRSTNRTSIVESINRIET